MTDKQTPTQIMIHCQQKDIKVCLDRIEKIQKHEKLINIAKQAFPQGSWKVTWIGELEFTLPMDFELIEEFKIFMKIQAPQLELKRENQYVWSSSKTAGHFLQYDEAYWHDGISVAFRSEEEGSTCVLNQIGEEMKPVYEVVCSEEAAQEFTVEEK